MSKPGKLVGAPKDIIKNQFKWATHHPVEAVALGLTAGAGASFLPAMLAGGGAGGAGGLAGILGPSEFTAAAAGDAFMPAAVGASGTGTAGLGSTLGSNFASGGASSFGNKLMAKQGLSMLAGGGQGQQGPPGGYMKPPEAQLPPIHDTVLYPQQGGGSSGLMGMAGIPPEVMRDPRKLQAWLQQQGGMA